MKRNIVLLLIGFLSLSVIGYGQSANVGLYIFDAPNFSGDTVAIKDFRPYNAHTIPGKLRGKISSLILKKGYQVVLATEVGGDGVSKTLIAAQRDIYIPQLSAELNDQIQFIRVLPWRNPIKKGYGGKLDAGVNSGWFYRWGLEGESTEESEFVPMAFSRWSTSPDNLNKIIGLNATTVLGFNEIDHNGHQGAKDGFLFDHNNAALKLKELHSTGCRIGSPNLREEGPWKWMPTFWDLAKEHQVRIDFVGVHWYDWGSAPKANPNPTAEQVFKRFKAYLTRVYNTYKLPIWITEFNANPFRNPQIQEEFLKMALPYLDSLPYIERYAYFQPFSKSYFAEETKEQNLDQGNGTFREIKTDYSTPLTRLGELWKNHKSVPSMNQEVYLGKNNLYEDEVELKR
jgi:hypothetical protein